MRKSILVLLLACSATSVSQDNASSMPTPPPQVKTEIKCDADPKELIRTSSEKDTQNRVRERNYTYIERQETHELAGDGSVKKTEVRTYEHFVIYGTPVQRLIAKDDKPLDEKEARKEEERIQKVIDKHKGESEEDRRKNEAKLDKEREEERKVNHELVDAFDYKLMPEVEIDGRTACVYEFTPKLGYQPKEKETKYLVKTKGHAWIDKRELQMIKLEAEFIDSVSWGWFLAKLSKGSRVDVEQVKVNDDVWLPKHVAVKVDAKFLVFKHFNMDIDITYKDYKKFNASSKISVVGEAEEKKDEIAPATTPIKKN